MIYPGGRASSRANSATRSATRNAERADNGSVRSLERYAAPKW
jgi:hypothetical protein